MEKPATLEIEDVLKSAPEHYKRLFENDRVLASNREMENVLKKKNTVIYRGGQGGGGAVAMPHRHLAARVSI